MTCRVVCRVADCALRRVLLVSFTYCFTSTGNVGKGERNAEVGELEYGCMQYPDKLTR